MPAILNMLKRAFAKPAPVREPELVNGPHLGYFVAAYSVPAIDGFIAYAKVFRSRPATPWDGLAIAKYTACSACAVTALSLAQARAIKAIAGWGR